MEGIHHPLDLRRLAGVEGPHLVVQGDDLGVVAPVTLREFGEALGYLHLLLLDLLDQGVAPDLGDGGRRIGPVGQGFGLAVPGLRLHAPRRRLDDLLVQLRQLLGGDRLGIGGEVRDDPLLLLVAQEGLVRRVHLLLFLVDLLI